MTERYDVVIFGATGFTGKNTIKSVESLTKENGRNYTWAVAGRSEAKLQAVLKEMGDKIGKDLSKTPMIIADVEDELSLEKMAKRARIIINTCGPFQFFGEGVVKACVENGCHVVDVSGEPIYIEGMQFKYHKEAQEKGVYVVSACGFDSVPCDLGLMYLQSKFEGTLNSVDTYVSVGEEGEAHPGPLLNAGTWSSLVNGRSTLADVQALRQKLFPTKLPEYSPKLASRGAVHKSPFDNSYALPFLGADRFVVERSQRFLYEEENKRPVQVGCYFTVQSIFSVFKIAFMGAIFMLLANFQFGRNWLLKCPGFFTLGVFSQEGPSEAKMENTKFTYTLMGEGWSSKMDDPKAEFTTKPDKKMIAQVNGKNPAYGSTCVSLTVCALTILDDPSKLPNKGGVYTTAAAFRNTSVIEQMHKHGLTFEIINKEK